MTYAKPTLALSFDATFASCCTGGGVTTNNATLDGSQNFATAAMSKLVVGGACFVPAAPPITPLQ